MFLHVFSNYDKQMAALALRHFFIISSDMEVNQSPTGNSYDSFFNLPLESKYYLCNTFVRNFKLNSETPCQNILLLL